MGRAACVTPWWGCPQGPLGWGFLLCPLVPAEQQQRTAWRAPTSRRSLCVSRPSLGQGAVGLADPPSCPTDPVPAPQPASQSSCPPFPTTATSGQPLPVRGQRARRSAPSHEPWPVVGTACAGRDGVLLQNSTGPASSASPGMDPELNSPDWLGKHWDPMSSSTGPSTGGRRDGAGAPLGAGKASPVPRGPCAGCTVLPRLCHQ